MLRSILKQASMDPERFAQRKDESIKTEVEDFFKQQNTAIKERAAKNKCFSFFYELVISVTFNFVVYCLIIFNTITLALYRYDESKEQQRILAILDVFFVWIFTLEMILKLIGVGLRNYIRDKFNFFDAMIVIISLVDFTIVSTGQFDEGQDNAILSALRALRLLRVAKLARQWTELQKILKTLVESLKEI